MKNFILTLTDIFKLLFGRFNYGVGDEIPRGQKLSEMDCEDVARGRLILKILKRHGFMEIL